MATNIASQFPDLLTADFAKIFYETYEQLPTMIPRLFAFPERGPRGDSYRSSQVGTLPEWTEFTGSVPYSTQAQGYDTTITYKEWVHGFMVER